MSIKQLLVLVGLCVLFSGCSTIGDLSGLNHETTTDKGMRYLLGRGVTQSDSKAFAYFTRAANEGDVFAQNELGYLYAAGKGTPRNYQQALFWYQKAANHGLASAQYNLGLMYLHGLGTVPNKELAQQWFQKAAAHGFEPARQALRS